MTVAFTTAVRRPHNEILIQISTAVTLRYGLIDIGTRQV